MTKYFNIKNIVYIIAIIFGTVIITSLWYLFYYHYFDDNILLFVGSNFFATLPLAFGISGFIKHQNYYEQLAFTILIAFLNGCIPLFGLIGITISLFAIRRPDAESDQQDILSVSIPEYVPSLENIGLSFGSGGARNQLMNADAVNTIRRSALLAISSKQGVDNNQMLLQALNDNNDEIRLIAYSLLDLQEQKITKEIESTTTLLEQAEMIDKKILFGKRLANLYYEATYRSLVQADALEQALEKVLSIAQAVIEQQRENDIKQSSSMWTLIGLVHRRKKDDDQAYQAFETANQLGAAESRTLPFLAEIKFKQRKFADIKSLLSSGKSLINTQKIGSTIRFWTDIYDRR